MALNRFKRTVFVAFLVALLIIGSAMQFSGELELRVTPVDDDGPLLVLPLKPGEPFTLHFYRGRTLSQVRGGHGKNARGGPHGQPRPI